MKETRDSFENYSTSHDLISFFRAIPDGHIRRGLRHPQWFLLLMPVLGIYCFAES
jgi:hypothetical protein